VLLFVKAPLLARIQRGQKTTTIRPWKTCRLVAGDLLHFPTGGNVRGSQVVARITDVRRARFGDLTAADARRDGFPTLRALREAFAAIYPALDLDAASVVVLTFVVVTNRSSSSARA
jgi:hypothetical protein